jgi:hypothetical protein
MSKRRMKRLSQKDQKNLVAIGAAGVAVVSAGLASLPAWPATTGVLNTVYTHGSNFVQYTGLNNGTLVGAAVVGGLVFIALFRK